MKKTIGFLICLVGFSGLLHCQPGAFSFRVRTITAGVTPAGPGDTATLTKAIKFCIEARKAFTSKGYEVQTLRVATSNLYSWLNGHSMDEVLRDLQLWDAIAVRNGVIISIGQVLEPDRYQAGIADWATRLVKATQTISFSLPISSHALGVHAHSIRAAAEIILALSKTDNGEANFRFTAAANCPAGIPFFPVAFHEGVNSFAIGLETP